MTQPLQPVVLDLETYFADDYTLSKLSTESYIRDPRFEAHGAAIKWQHNIPAKWYAEKELRYVLKEHDWSNTLLIAWHAQFDALILSHHYDVHPARIACPMSMFRMLYGTSMSASLEKVRLHFGMPSKTTPYQLFKGKHWHELDAATQEQVGDGAVDEAESIWSLFGKFAQDFPPEEFEVLDSVIKMFTEPVLRADTALLAKVWESEAIRKQERLQELNVAATDLASADKFTQLLALEGIEVEYKTGKNKPIPCFAKTDNFMRALLEHPNERIRTLAEARLGEKSTFLQTRAETLGWKASRGALPVYLFYAGAGTLRPSGGDGDNWLNFKRGSDIRRAIVAPEGYLLAPVDSSQIECRCLHYLAGGPDEPVIQQFRNRQDPYVDLATKFYKEPIYKPKQDDPRRDEMEAKRGMGKQGRLMCLAAETIVLTDNGYKPITAVCENDRLWDGIEWVTHQGLIYQGEQNVVDLKGVRMTSDHQILCGIYGWQPAASCLQNENMLFRALESGKASLPSRGMNSAQKTVLNSLLFGARAAAQNIRSVLQTFMLDARSVVEPVPQSNRDFGLKNITAMPISAPTKSTELACLGASLLFTIAPKQTVKTNGTADAVLRFTNLGEAKGEDENSSPIWSRFPVGISQNLKSIELITTAAINRAIFVLLRVKFNKAINVPCGKLKKKLPTYDISFAGPRNRFTILSEMGPLIVHNCGYGASGKQFKATAKNGLYGPSVEISLEDSNDFVALYRADNPSICARNTGYWAQAERMIARLTGGPPVDWGPLHVRDGRIYLPNGCPIVYDSLEFHRPDADEEVRDFEANGYWRMRTKRGFKKMWGSKLVQNICEAVSRVIVTQAQIRITRLGYRILNHPYDELLCLIPKDGKEEWHVQRCKAEMTREVPWLPGLPLDCEAHLGERYMK